MKFCKKCRLDLPEENFYKHKSRPDGLSFYCKQCDNLRNAKIAEMHKSRSNIIFDSHYICGNCNQTKLAKEFTPDKRKFRGVLKNCKDCRNMLQRKYIYGLTHEKFLELLASQNFQCAVCECKLETNTQYNTNSLNIDHCHATKIVRGLLCRHCNIGLGHFKDSVELMEKAINYLNKANKLLK